MRYIAAVIMLIAGPCVRMTSDDEMPELRQLQAKQDSMTVDTLLDLRVMRYDYDGCSYLIVTDDYQLLDVIQHKCEIPSGPDVDNE